DPSGVHEATPPMRDEMAASVRRDTIPMLIAAAEGKLMLRLLPEEGRDGRTFKVLEISGAQVAPVKLYIDAQNLIARQGFAARERRPDVFVAIDFPDFNFRLMSALHELKIPIVYYVAPQLWAWRPHRMETMKRLVDKVLVIFPFEAPLYERAGVPVEFVGHPLVDLATAGQPRSAFLRDRGLGPDAPTVALLPGSRPTDLQRIVPGLVAA